MTTSAQLYEAAHGGANYRGPVSRRAVEDRARRLCQSRAGVAVRATYDSAGNCQICGEAGRCLGWHLPEEVERVANASAPAPQLQLSLS
jgi:hypothetical protein